MTALTIHIHLTTDCLPDADTDVLVWEAGESEAQLGALNCDDPVEFVDAQGGPITVVAWAALPMLTEPRTIETVTGERVDLAEPWRVPG